ncbi:hypothetical protein ACWQ06_14095 [Streptomyces angustmyceticus]
MRRTTTVAAASAAVLCLGSLLAGCGGAADEGYVAVGAAGPADGRAPSRGVPPEGSVELTPLDGAGGRGGQGGDGRSEGPGDGGSAQAGPSGAGADTGAGKGDGAGGAGDPGRPGASGAPRATSAPSAGAHTGHGHGGATSPASPSAPNSPTRPGGSTPPHGSHTPEPPSPTIPAGPGAPRGLLIGKPALADTDVRWCQKVSLDFLNGGERPVTTGTVTFGTHIIGGLGVDWATRTSTHALPLPLAVGKKRTGTWRVCVDSWRVPLGMHLDTKDVTFTWK